MSRELEWTGQEEYVSKPLDSWYMEGRVVGLARSANGLTFATINDAGHMVCSHIIRSRRLDLTVHEFQAPYDKPKETLELLKRWLAGQEP